MLTLPRFAGIVAVMDGPETGPFNVGNPTEFTMIELAELVKEVANPSAEIVFQENTADDPAKRKPDISKVGRFSGWSLIRVRLHHPALTLQSHTIRESENQCLGEAWMSMRSGTGCLGFEL